MADSDELHKLEPRLNVLTAEFYDETFSQRTATRSRSWTGPESVAETSVGSPSEATSLRNGLSARHGSLKSRSGRFPGPQGDIVRALEARVQNRSFGRHGDISKALEARERNRVSLQRGESVDGKVKQGRATDGVTAGGGNSHFEGEPKGRGHLLPSQNNAVDSSVLLNAGPEQEKQSVTSTPAVAGGDKKQRKSNLKSSSTKVGASLDEDRKDVPKGRVLILTSGPLVETGVSTPEGLHPEDGFSSSSKTAVHVEPPPEAPSVRFSSPLVLPGLAGVGTVQTEGGGYQLDQGDGFLGADVSLDDKGAGRPWEIKDEEELSRVPPEWITRSTEIASESSSSSEDLTATHRQGPSPQVSATEQEREDFSTVDHSQDSAVLDADLEARLRRLTSNDESSLSSPFGEIPTRVMSLSDQVKALRSGSTRLLVSHLTPSACAPDLSTRVLSMSSSRLPSSVSGSRVQGKVHTSSSKALSTHTNPVLAPESASHPSSFSCCCFPTCVKRRRRRRRKLNGTAGRPGFSHSFPPSGLQKMQTPVPSKQLFRAEEEVRIFEIPVEEGEVVSFLEPVSDEVQLESPEADRRKAAAQMQESLYGPKVLKSFSLKDVNEELSKVSQEAESLAREAESLIQWANDSARLGQEWADEEDLNSCNGDIPRPVTHTEACLSH